MFKCAVCFKPARSLCSITGGIQSACVDCCTGKAKARRFRLQRSEDLSGISGTGVVAEGVEFVNGMIALSWFGSHHGVNVYASMRTCIELHGHENRTKVEWIDA